MSGYAQDYIGQLARSGQIDAKRMGGLWYVYMPSLEGYKTKSPEASESKKVASDSDPGANSARDSDVLVSFDGKDYISANRASKITGYNQDYVGQLARSGKILSRQVGNRWYVDRDGIVAHKEQKDSLLAAVQTEAVGIRPQAQEEQPPVSDPGQAFEAQLMNYVSDEADLTPHIEEKSDWRIEHVTEADDETISIHGEVPKNDLSPEYEIPIHVVKKPLIPQKRSPYKGSADQRGSIKRGSTPKIPLSIGVLIFSFVIIGSFGAVALHSGAINPANMTASALTTTSKRAFNKVLSTFENLIDPELVYNRSN